MFNLVFLNPRPVVTSGGSVSTAPKSAVQRTKVSCARLFRREESWGSPKPSRTVIALAVPPSFDVVRLLEAGGQAGDDPDGRDGRGVRVTVVEQSAPVDPGVNLVTFEFETTQQAQAFYADNHGRWIEGPFCLKLVFASEVSGEFTEKAGQVAAGAEAEEAGRSVVAGEAGKSAEAAAATDHSDSPARWAGKPVELPTCAVRLSRFRGLKL